ncbi:MAG: rod shape-determining protein MreC [Methylophilaceae bacterium]|jgi:rod shape-determining protein MreC|nr:rod shape-determining protein MreC [Methylophilaceae bacterium]
MLKGVHQKLEHQQAPTFFVRGISVFSRMVFFFALSIVLMAVDARLNYLSQVRQAFASGLQPLERIANIPGELIRDSKKHFSIRNQLVQDNYILKQQALENAVKLQRLNTLQAKNEYLRSLLGGDAPIYPRAVFGDISHAGRDPFKKVVIVNRGRQHNIQAGQAVVDAKGVLGQVTRVYPFSSEITMITDKSLSIPVQVERNQLRAIAFGQGGNRLDIPYLPSNVDIKIGDKLVTSGLDGIYPAGLAVATVTRIDQDPEASFAKIISTPAAKVNHHSQLLILPPPESKEAPSNKVIDNKGTKPNAKNT